MNRITPAQAKAIRTRNGKRLIDLAIAANVAPATVRSFELGGTCRWAVQERLQVAYAKLRQSEKQK